MKRNILTNPQDGLVQSEREIGYELERMQHNYDIHSSTESIADSDSGRARVSPFGYYVNTVTGYESSIQPYWDGNSDNERATSNGETDVGSVLSPELTPWEQSKHRSRATQLKQTWKRQLRRLTCGIAKARQRILHRDR